MGFCKTIIYGAKCDKCGAELYFRLENPGPGTNPTKTSTADTFRREGWKITRTRYLCPKCIEVAQGGRNEYD